jgi:hypothetical protein
LSKPINRTEAARTGERLDNGREQQALWYRPMMIRVPLLVSLLAPVSCIASRFSPNVAAAADRDPDRAVNQIASCKVIFRFAIFAAGKYHGLTRERRPILKQ